MGRRLWRRARHHLRGAEVPAALPASLVQQPAKTARNGQSRRPASSSRQMQSQALRPSFPHTSAHPPVCGLQQQDGGSRRERERPDRGERERSERPVRSHRDRSASPPARRPRSPPRENEPLRLSRELAALMSQLPRGE